MANKHTPGPWVVSKDHHVYAEQFFKPAPFTSIEGVEYPDYMDGLIALPYACEGVTNEANARLIAAAPELLEALQMVLEGHEDGESLERALPFVKAAIAKAKG